MRVLFVNSVCGTGSTGKIVFDLCRELNSNGHETMVCFGRGKSVQGVRSIRVSSKLGVYFHAILSRVTGLNGCFSLFSTCRLIRIIEKFNPDIVHLHNLHGYYLNYYMIVKYLNKKKTRVIWTLHDELMFTGNCAYAYGCKKWEKQCYGCTQKKEYPMSMMFDFSEIQYRWKRRTFSNLSNFCFVTPSEWLKRRVQTSLLQNNTCNVIHNGIDIDDVFYLRTEKQLREKLKIGRKKIVLTVSDDIYNERKGIKQFIELACMNAHQDIAFLIVGGVMQECISENVFFVECTKNQDELAAYYSMADLFVITSQCDNFPTVCLEALACGTAIVGFDVGGIPETATDPQIGCFVKLNDMNALSAAVNDMLNKDREQLKIRCRDYAKTHYHKNRMVNDYMKLYMHIAKK